MSYNLRAMLDEKLRDHTAGKSISLAVILQKLSGWKLMKESFKMDWWDLVQGALGLNTLDFDLWIPISAFACLSEACYIDECMVLMATFLFLSLPFRDNYLPNQGGASHACCWASSVLVHPAGYLLSMDNMTGIQSVKRLTFAEKGLASRISCWSFSTPAHA